MERMQKHFEEAVYKGEVDEEQRMSGFGVLVAANGGVFEGISLPTPRNLLDASFVEDLL